MLTDFSFSRYIVAYNNDFVNIIIYFIPIRDFRDAQVFIPNYYDFYCFTITISLNFIHFFTIAKRNSYQGDVTVMDVIANYIMVFINSKVSIYVADFYAIFVGTHIYSTTILQDFCFLHVYNLPAP